MQERRGERSRTICSCIHLNTQRNYPGESTLEFSWSQEQTLRLPLDLHSQVKRTYDHYHHTFSFLATFFLLWNTHEFCG